ncbi:MAG TPA: SAM-dependent methyltransferase [Planctomycetota bacterium]|nr:SAM-dependent methyltransferase [Planctomycetota bacterium]
MSTPIRNVSDTALWVAMYRAFESERPDAIFRDPYARRLAGERGEAIVSTLRHGRAMAWPMVVRTAVMDEIVLRCVQQGCRTVLNLAAGLDTRAWRLPLPADLRWIDADLPDMVAYKQERLAGEKTACEYEAVPVDLVDAAARERLFAHAAERGPVLTLAEGLLVYLETDAVAALSQHLHAHAAMRWWLFDLASPKLLAYLNRSVGKQLQAGNAPLRFGPAEGTAFFLPHWREVEFRSTWQEALRLHRTMKVLWLWKLLDRLAGEARREKGRRFSGIVLLERT